MKIVIEDKLDWKREDGGAALIGYPMYEILSDEEDPDGEGEETIVGVRIVSWDDKFYCGVRDTPVHEKFMKMVGKKVRVTIELLEE